MERYEKNNWIRIGILNDKPAIELNADTLEEWLNNDLFFVNVYRIAKGLGRNVAFVIFGEPDNQDIVFERLGSIESKMLIGDVIVEFIRSYNITQVKVEAPTTINVTEELIQTKVESKRKKK